MNNPKGIKRFLALFPSSRERPDPALLKEAFRSHYASFRSLLTANNNALELMATMEQALSEGRPFGMAFVRGHSTALSVNVYKMIDSLQKLSDGKYGGLEEVFGRIAGEIDHILASRPAVPDGKYILPLSEVSGEDADLAGDKMANLGEVRNRLGLRVPPGFVITAAATLRFMGASGLQDEINRQLKTLDIENLEELYTVSARIQQLIADAPLPDDLAAAILDAYKRLSEDSGKGVPVSMRSSAVGEDSRSVSFAGQYRTQLDVGEEFLLQTYKEIVASKYRCQAIIYRHQRGFRHQDVVMCVGCMAMVDSATSGVMFTRSPGRVHGAGWVEINAAAGSAAQVVAGSVKTDLYRISREDPNRVELESQADDASLSVEQLHELAHAAGMLEEHFGAPQDVEWSLDREGNLVILQSRPLAGPSGHMDRAATDAPCSGDVLYSGGLTVSPGAACGQVFTVRTNVDMLEFPKGAILAVEHPLPEWASLMNRASAVISETGHGATHLAIVAREFSVPALFGAAGALQKLANGAMVTLDASSRCVFPGIREDTLKDGTPRPNLMADSPIYRLLKKVSQLVIPLNLTDPESPLFMPANCRTLHDIARFCHERAVSEMFFFGEKTGFDLRTAKQLAGKTALKWWVIDLDNGFRDGYDRKEKYVFIQDIVSEPMLSIWEGMTAREWGGPPPVSIRGFGSILYRSTMNPSIDPAVRASMGNKNYFLISRNFCNLSMRLGYHFSLVEAYAGPLLTENYVSFQFRGGAADRSRRFVRVNLLKEILEEYGFRVEVLLDALTARIEKRSRKYLLERLKVLGYLLIHTRQIDMVMGERIMVDRYREKIRADLRELVAPSQGGFPARNRVDSAGS